MRFCNICGTPVETVAAPGDAVKPAISSPKKAKLKIDALPKFAVPALAVVAAAVLVILAIGIFKPSKYDITKSVFIFWPDYEEETILVIMSGKNQVKLDGRLDYEYDPISVSTDGIKAAILINDTGKDSYGKYFEGYSLYHVSDKVTLITDEVHKAKMSASGNAIAFVKDYDKDTEEGTLYLWNNGKTTMVSDSMLANLPFCISPDGKSVAFASGTLDDYSGSYYNGNIGDLGKSIEPFAIADNERYVYYAKNSSYYVMLGNDGEKQKLGDDIDVYYFNKDLSQMVYESNGKTYAIIKGDEKISLSGAIESFILPDNTMKISHIIGVKSFANTLYISGEDIIRIDDKFEASSVAKKFNSNKNRYLASDGKTLLYTKSDDLYKIDALNKNATAIKLVDGNVTNFEAVNKGSAVYFINEENELYYQKGNGKPVHIADDVTSASYSWEYGAIAGFKDKILYYVSDEELYTSTGQKGNLVSGIDIDVDFVFANMYIIEFASDDNELNWSSDGKTYTRIGNKRSDRITGPTAAPATAPPATE
jgi:hypothetical protein